MEILKQETVGYVTRILTGYDSFNEYCDLHSINENEGISPILAKEVIRYQMEEQGIYEVESLMDNRQLPGRKEDLEDLEAFLKELSEFEDKSRISEFECYGFENVWGDYVSKTVHAFCKKIEKGKRRTKGSKLKL